jgi:hypothetical protein
MSLPGMERSMVRDVLYGVTLGLLLVVPTVLGFRIASAATTTPPEPDEVVEFSGSEEAATAAAAAQVLEDRPLGDAPSSTEDALTRGSSDSGLPRLTFITEDDSFAIDSGDTVSLGDGYSVRVSLDPFPPAQFDVAVEFAITRDGSPVTDATIDTVWDMTFMRHGPFDTRLAPADGGAYTADYEFFMFGPWQLDTVLTTPDARHEFAVSVYVWPN